MKFIDHGNLYELAESIVKFMRLWFWLIAIPVVLPALEKWPARPNSLGAVLALFGCTELACQILPAGQGGTMRHPHPGH